MFAELQNSIRKFNNVRINQRFAAADTHDRRTTFRHGMETFIHREPQSERDGIFPNASATAAFEIAGVERFEHEYERQFGSSAQFFSQHVRCHTHGQRKGKSHRSMC
jgi:hypothetical protein